VVRVVKVHELNGASYVAVQHGSRRSLPTRFSGWARWSGFPLRNGMPAPGDVCFRGSSVEVPSVGREIGLLDCPGSKFSREGRGKAPRKHGSRRG
jgi:hypothetical protein